MMDYLAKLPEVISQPHPTLTRRPRLLTPVWGTLRSSFSSITWFYAHAAMQEAAVEGAFVLESKRHLRLQASGALWKLQRMLRRQQVGGYKFAEGFSDVLWSRYLPDLHDTVIISNFQVLGRYFLRHHARLNVTPIFYIDGTLTEYFSNYGAVEKSTLDPRVAARAIAMERDAYQHATHIFTMSRATGRSLTDVYDVAPERVSLLLPGANLDDATVPPPSAHQGWVGAEFTLGFVGLYPYRKGLDKLAAAMQVLRSRKVPIRLCVIGRCPDEIAKLDGVDFLGAINKTTDHARFITALRAVDLGCQLSRAELLGIAALEFLRLGVPIMATNVGGMPDVLHNDDGGVLVAADISVEQLVDELQRLITDTTRYQALRQAAIRRAEWASWRRTAHEMNSGLASVA